MSHQPPPNASESIVRVGTGRGFLVAAVDAPLILTAVQCLPRLPPAHLWSDTDQRTYKGLVGPLTDEEPALAAECLFADPVSDVAILSGPVRTASDDAEAFDAFIADKPCLRIVAPHDGMSVWLLTLDGAWRPGVVSKLGLRQFTRLMVDHPSAHAPGTSGSPILTSAGDAVALVSLGTMNPSLLDCLPRWLTSRLLDEGRQ